MQRYEEVLKILGDIRNRELTPNEAYDQLSEMWGKDLNEELRVPTTLGEFNSSSASYLRIDCNAQVALLVDGKWAIRDSDGDTAILDVAALKQKLNEVGTFDPAELESLGWSL